MSVRIQTGDIEPILLYVAGRDGKPLLGATDIYVTIRRVSDGYYLDWDDYTFKNAGWVELNRLSPEIDATNSPGMYEVIGGLNTASITNPSPDDTLSVLPKQTPGVNALLPPPGEIKVGQWVDNVDSPSSDIKAQADKIDIAATIGPAAVTSGSLLDRIANKDVSKTFSQLTDSLEGIRDRSG